MRQGAVAHYRLAHLSARNMRLFRNSTIKGRLSAIFAISLGLMFAIGAVALVELSTLNTIAVRLAEDSLREMELLGQIHEALDEHQIMLRGRVDAANIRPIAPEQPDMASARERVEEGVRNFVVVAYEPKEKVLIEQFREAWKTYLASYNRIINHLDGGDINSARVEFNSTIRAAIADAHKAIDELIANSRSEGYNAAEKVQSVFWLSLEFILGILLVGALIVGAANRWVSSNVSKPILGISDAMRRLAAGDETAAVTEVAGRVDEIGVLEAAVSGYRESLGRIRHLAEDAKTERDRLDAALANMSQGLCMFDSDGRLVVFNHRFIDIYGLPPEEVSTGLTVPEILALSARACVATDADPEATLQLRNTLARDPKAGMFVQRLTDGRSISVSYQPRPQGGFVITFADITAELRVQERVRHLAHYDALTDLPNRMTFYEAIGTTLTHLRRSESTGVFSLDLDHFKNVNDTLGHPVGDSLLKLAAERMRSCVRSDDIVARLGGDEFAIVQAPAEQGQDITMLAARLIEVVGAPYHIDGHQVIVGVSVGIALAPTDGREPDVLMKNADLALYRAKADGGGAYRFFEMQMDARMQARRALELDLRNAALNHEFELYFQPIVDVKSRQVTSCEALIRWHHPKKGIIAPLEFIPIAEETGIIVPIGEWVLRQACLEAARWPGNVTVAVNLSPAQFKSRGLVDSVIDALKKARLAPERLELEITELVLLQDNQGASSILHQLRELGIKIGMDDFGTGYSSLGYLRSFPFDKIKIDRSFVRDFPAKGESTAIIRAVVGLGRSLGMKTTAEGVETQEQLAGLMSEGCSEAQGFLFSKPRPAKEIARFFADAAPQIADVA
jgi:diguanylate cyclase (GGDEF)-like protein/PAS domain S-box-containing protein